MFKKIVCLCAVVLMLFSLTACEKKLTSRERVEKITGMTMPEELEE